VLDTGSQKIPTFPSTDKIAADLYIVSNFSELLAAKPIPVFVKEHGQVSRTASRKHSLQIATLSDAGKMTPMPLLGFPAGKKWILYAPYPDKTLIRNELAYNLSREAGEWAAHTKGVELVVLDNGELKRTSPAKKDGKEAKVPGVRVFDSATGQPGVEKWWTEEWYHGVYILEEKIEVSVGRVAIDKGDGRQLHGVLARTDKQDTGDPFFTTSLTGITVLPNVEPKSPSLDETHELQNWFDRMEESLFGGCTISAQSRALPSAAFEHDHNAMSGEQLGFLHWPSFIDNFLVQEMSRNVDGYRWSTYFFKQTSSAALAEKYDDVLNYHNPTKRRARGGTTKSATSLGLWSAIRPTAQSGLLQDWARRREKLEAQLQLHMSPIWDFNIAFGNAEHLDGAQTHGWMYENDVLRKYADQPRTHSAYWYCVHPAILTSCLHAPYLHAPYPHTPYNTDTIPSCTVQYRHHTLQVPPTTEG
jgi:hypothetical protein